MDDVPALSVTLYRTDPEQRILVSSGGGPAEALEVATGRISLQLARFLAEREGRKLAVEEPVTFMTYSPIALAHLLEGQRRFAAADFDFDEEVTLHNPELREGRLGLGEALFHYGGFAGSGPVDARLALERVAEEGPFAPVEHHLAELAMWRGDSLAARHAITLMSPTHPARPEMEMAFDPRPTRLRIRRRRSCWTRSARRRTGSEGRSIASCSHPTPPSGRNARRRGEAWPGPTTSIRGWSMPTRQACPLRRPRRCSVGPVHN